MDLYRNQHISDDQRVELCFALGVMRMHRAFKNSLPI